MKELIKAVRAHASKNYEKGGWDILVECYDDAEIEKVLYFHSAKTEEQAIAALAEVLGIIDERRREIQAEAF